MKVDNKKITKKSNKKSNKISNTSNKISNEDFNSQLYKLLSDQNEVDDNVCLITNLPLEHEYITLQCDHKFNYPGAGSPGLAKITRNCIVCSTPFEITGLSNKKSCSAKCGIAHTKAQSLVPEIIKNRRLNQVG